MIRKGDTIEILPAFRDAGDDQFTWKAVSNEANGRVDICPVDIPLVFKPLQTVLVEQVRVVKSEEGH